MKRIYSLIKKKLLVPPFKFLVSYLHLGKETPLINQISSSLQDLALLFILLLPATSLSFLSLCDQNSHFYLEFLFFLITLNWAGS
jgi:hypothetical protein